MYWACMSVGKPGYSWVVTSRARSLLPRLDGERGAAVQAFTLIANHLHAHLFQFGKDGSEVLRVAAFHGEVPAGNGRRNQECPRFNAVRNNGVLSAVQPADAADADLVRPCAFDMRAHLVEQIARGPALPARAPHFRGL